MLYGLGNGMKGVSMKKGSTSIVIGFDYTDGSRYALRAGLQIADSMPSCEPHVCCVARSADGPVRLEIDGAWRTLGFETAASMLRATVERELGLAAIRGTNLHFDHVVTHVRIGDPATKLLELATEVDASLIALGATLSSGFKRRVLGSVGDTVMRRAHCPLYVAHPKGVPELAAASRPEAMCAACMYLRSTTDGRIDSCSRHKRPEPKESGAQLRTAKLEVVTFDEVSEISQVG